MLSFSKVSLADKEILNNYLMTQRQEVNELSFSNLFMYRDCHNYTYTFLNDYLIIHSDVHFEKRFFYFPVGVYNEESFIETIIKLKEYFAKDDLRLEFRLVTATQLEVFKSLASKYSDKITLEYEFDRDNSDYLYLASDLIELKGKKFDAKRNHIHYFTSNYSHEYHKITPENISECYNILNGWCKVMDCSAGDYLPCEKRANIEMLDNLEALGCSGCLIKVNGKFEAYSIAEMLNNDTAVIHIEKANINFKGLYQFINQQFCENQWSSVTYINREQDLGITGLRKAKESYNPVSLVEKYTVLL